MKKLSIIILLLVLMAIGCSRYIDSEDLDFQPPDAPPVPFSLNVTHLADGISLSWLVTDTVDGMTFKVYYREESATQTNDYLLWQTTSDFSSVITGLSPDAIYQFAVASVLPGNIEGEKSIAASSQVGVISVIINNDDMYTDSRTVSVDFVIPGSASLMQVAENSDFAGAHWQNYRTSLSFELSTGDGVKYVYARFRFTDGSISDSLTPAMDSIILDTETSIDSVYFSPSGTTLTAGDTLDLYIATSEKDGTAYISFPGLNNYELNYDESLSDTLAGDYIYYRSYTIPANLETVDAQVTGHFTDAAGNQAEAVMASTLLNIADAPTPVTIFAATQSSSSIRLNWSEAIDNDFAAYHLYRSESEPVSQASDVITVVNARSTVQYVDSELDDDTQYFYRIYVYDNTGKSVGSNVDSATTLVNLPPDSVSLAVRADGDTAVVLTWTMNHDSDFDSYRIYRGTYEPSSLRAIFTSQSTTEYTEVTGPGTFYYNVVVFDKQGKHTLSSWVGVDLGP